MEKSAFINLCGFDLTNQQGNECCDGGNTLVKAIEIVFKLLDFVTTNLAALEAKIRARLEIISITKFATMPITFARGSIIAILFPSTLADMETINFNHKKLVEVQDTFTSATWTAVTTNMPAPSPPPDNDNDSNYDNDKYDKNADKTTAASAGVSCLVPVFPLHMLSVAVLTPHSACLSHAPIVAACTTLVTVELLRLIVLCAWNMAMQG